MIKMKFLKISLMYNLIVLISKINNPFSIKDLIIRTIYMKKKIILDKSYKIFLYLIKSKISKIKDQKY